MSLFFKKKAVLWFLNSHLTMGLKLSKKEALSAEGPLKKAKLPEGVSKCIGVLPSDQVLSTVIEVPSELEGDLLAIHIQKSYSEWLPLVWEESQKEWAQLLEGGNGTKRYLLVGVSHSTLAKYQARVEEANGKEYIWMPEALAIIIGLREKINLSESVLMALKTPESWVLIGLHRGFIIDDQRVENFNEFESFYDSYTQQTGVFPSKLIAVTDGEWPEGFLVNSVLSNPEKIQLKINEKNLVVQALEGAMESVELCRKSGFLLCPQIESE